jgi:hypothetical protein
VPEPLCSGRLFCTSTTERRRQELVAIGAFTGVGFGIDESLG